MSELGLPRLFGPYVLLKKLGSGATASVHVAQPLGSSRGLPSPLVVKSLHRIHLGDRESVQRFQHEATIAVAVDHPHVVPIYDVGMVAQVPYLAMEYAEGWQLSRLFADLLRRRARLPLGAAIGLIAGGLSGLEALHQAVDPKSGEPLGVVHRDLSPKNLMLGHDGRLLIIDLGLGKSNVQDWQTATGTIMGTLGYMAPEQVLSERIDHRTDLYTFALVLYELLSLKPYIRRGTTSQMLTEMAQPEYVELSRVRGDLPRELDRVLRRALDPDPERRFDSAVELSEALQSIAAPMPQTELAAAVIGPELISELAKVRKEVAQLLDEGADTEEMPPIDETLVFAQRTGVTTFRDHVRTEPHVPIPTGVKESDANDPTRPLLLPTQADPSEARTRIVDSERREPSESQTRPAVPTGLSDEAPPEPSITVPRSIAAVSSARAAGVPVWMVVLLVVSAVLATMAFERLVVTKERRERSTAVVPNDEVVVVGRAENKQPVDAGLPEEPEESTPDEPVEAQKARRKKVVSRRKPKPRPTEAKTKEPLSARVARLSRKAGRALESHPEQSKQINELMLQISMWGASDNPSKAAAELDQIEARLEALSSP